MRLTYHPADEFAPAFSPDGRSIAFSACYDGNTDGYVVYLDGGFETKVMLAQAFEGAWSDDRKRLAYRP